MTPHIFGIRSNISTKLHELETSNLVCSFAFRNPSGRPHSCRCVLWCRTPKIKAMLRRKNKLMPFGRVEEAGALAGRIGTEITRRNEVRLLTVSRKSSIDLWATVRQLTGRKQDEGATVDGVTAESLNDHYTAISTDHSYTPPHRRQYTATDVESMSTNGASLTY